MGAYLWAAAIRRGLLGGSRPWMAILAVAGTLRLIRRLSGSEPETVYREELKAGQALIVTHHRKQRLGDELR
ncbi:MAG: hypothetical protein KY439_02895 [Actinobacteria bacterium]|nr:hypothetical protein [Actinomycetota bacterium]